MERVGPNSLKDLEITLDQLIENEKALSLIASDPYFEDEALALKKMQESLLAHLIHIDEHFKVKKSKGIHTQKIQEKRKRLKRLQRKKQKPNIQRTRPKVLV